MTDDARVAEIVGYEFWRYTGRGTLNHHILCRLPKDKPSQKQYFERAYLKDFDSDIVFDEPPPPFISAPTGNTDQIVLEWVQGQDMGFTEKFTEKLLEIIWGGIPQHEVTEPLHEYVRFRRPGDMAKAVLAVKEAR